MARIPEEVINEIRNKADIVEVISSYIQLTHKGRNYMGICPFHDDHNPSMSVSPDKQIYHCFVCGAGGNVFKFVQDYEKISFIEAVLKVAEMAHVEVNDAYKQQKEIKINPQVKTIYDVMQDAVEYTNYELGTLIATQHLDYLHFRGINDKIIEKFQIGYDPQDDLLIKYLIGKHHTIESIVESGIAVTTVNGIRDSFANRITFPIHNANGNPVAFTARRVDDNSELAKYINTSQTKAYSKGKLLFNYHRVKSAVKKSGRVIVVEGAMDVIGFEKAGIDYAVATLGTAVTPDQIRLLKFLKVPVTVCYDGDAAGQFASYKMAVIAKQNGLEVEIAVNTTGLDPDELFEQQGREGLLKVAETTVSYIEFMFGFLKTRFNLENYSERKKYAEKMAEQINLVENEFERKTYYERLKNESGFNYETAKVVPKVVYTQRRSGLNPPLSGIYKAECIIVAMMLKSSRAANQFHDEQGFMPDIKFQNLAYYIFDSYQKHGTINTAQLLDEINEEDVKQLLVEIESGDFVPNGYNQKVLDDAFKKIQDYLARQQDKQYLKRIPETSDVKSKIDIANRWIQEKRKRGND